MNLLIERAKWGDNEAAEALVAELKQRLERMAAYYANACKEDAGDLMQEAWLGVLDGVKDVDLTIGTPRQYLLERAKWRILDYVKYNKRRKHNAIEEFMLEDNSPRVEDSALASAFTDDFMTRLTPKQRKIVKQLMKGRTWREAGEHLGCSSANVAYYVRQIRQEFEKLEAER